MTMRLKPDLYNRVLKTVHLFKKNISGVYLPPPEFVTRDLLILKVCRSNGINKVMVVQLHFVVIRTDMFLLKGTKI